VWGYSRTNRKGKTLISIVGLDNIYLLINININIIIIKDDEFRGNARIVRSTDQRESESSKMIRVSERMRRSMTSVKSAGLSLDGEELEE
jgi:hypothetical protein